MGFRASVDSTGDECRDGKLVQERQIRRADDRVSIDASRTETDHNLVFSIAVEVSDHEACAAQRLELCPSLRVAVRPDAVIRAKVEHEICLGSPIELSAGDHVRRKGMKEGPAHAAPKYIDAITGKTGDEVGFPVV